VLNRSQITIERHNIYSSHTLTDR